MYSSLEAWIHGEAIPFSPEAAGSFGAAVDAVVSRLGDGVRLLGFGEALHGDEDIHSLRNRLFRRLVEAHGFSAIAVESSFPRGWAVDDYVAGRGAASFDEIRETGFSHGFGALDANRELVDWMRERNAAASHEARVSFYGFDGPMEMSGAESPRRLLGFALDYLAVQDADRAMVIRERVEPLLGPDAGWENPAAAMDPSLSLGLTENAAALRLETEDLITDLWVRRPDLVAGSGEQAYLDAVHHAKMARQLLVYHAGMARASDDRIARLLGLRDAMMADNLAHIVHRERGRGRVLAFAHNSHLQRCRAEWRLGPYDLAWWPAGAHAAELLGDGYAAIGTAVVTSEGQGIGRPEEGSLEARLASAPGPARFIPTRGAQGLPAGATTGLPVRSGSPLNPTYFALTAASLTGFDWLCALDSIR